MRALALVARLRKVAPSDHQPAERVTAAASGTAGRRHSRIFFIALRVQLVHAIPPAAVATAATVSSSGATATSSQVHAPPEKPSSLKLWTEALTTIAYLLRDSVICTCAARLVNYLYAQGNLLSRHSPALFAVAWQFYTGLSIGFAAVVAQAASFLPLHFLEAPTVRPGFASCLYRVLKRCIWNAGLSIVGSTLSAYALITKELVVVDTFKLQNYICGTFVFNFIIGVDLAGRRLYQLETIEGQTRGHMNTQSYLQRWKLLVVKKKAALLAFCLILVYVHLTTLVDLSGLDSLTFAIGCIVLKLIAQETFTSYVLQQCKSSLKTMYILVAAPTVVIDTQLRIALLRSSGITSSVSVIQPVVLAGVELVARLAKILLVHWRIEARLSKVKARIASGSSEVIFSDDEGSTVERRRRSNESMRVLGESRRGVERTGDLAEFLRWRARLLRFHGAEAHADMYAEYIAIGCSMLIFFFFHCHPKYGSVFVAQTGSTGGNPTSYSSTVSKNTSMLRLRNQNSLLFLQIGLKVLVDLVCCTLELSQGISFKAARRMGVFISGLFVFFSILSIGVSANFYLQPTAI